MQSVRLDGIAFRAIELHDADVFRPRRILVYHQRERYRITRMKRGLGPSLFGREKPWSWRPYSLECRRARPERIDAAGRATGPFPTPSTGVARGCASLRNNEQSRQTVHWDIVPQKKECAKSEEAGQTRGWSRPRVCTLVVATGYAQSISPLSIIVTASEPEAQRVRESLIRGEDFATLARSQSIDPSAHDGGYLGNLDPANLRRELREALKGVGAGQLSAIVKIPSGYAILKVLKEAPGKETNQAIPTKTQAVAARARYG